MVGGNESPGPVAEATIIPNMPNAPNAKNRGDVRVKSGVRISRLTNALSESLGNILELAEKDVPQETREKILKFAAESHASDYSLVQRLAERMERVGVSFPAVEVRFKNVNVHADIPMKEEGKIVNVFSAFVDGCNALFEKLVPTKVVKTRPFYVVNNVSGVLRPGRMCLMLGPPASGRTTLLKALAGQIVHKKNRSVKLSGEVTYNGLVPHRDFVVERVASYFDQQDKHIAEMTVEETIAFASECMGFSVTREIYRVLREKEIAAGISVPKDDELDHLLSTGISPGGNDVFVDINMMMLGINHVAKTVVGDDSLKGISGGQKRRVTIAEMAVGLHQVLLMDEISTGLDSATTYDIVRSFRNACIYANTTVLATLLQPSPQVFELFDDIILMSQGRIVFQGPREDIVPFFNGLNLHCPPTMTVPDFLQEVTNSQDQHKYYGPAATSASLPSGDINGDDGVVPTGPSDARDPGSVVPPFKYRSPREIQRLYEQTDTWQQIQRTLDSDAYSHPLQGVVLPKEKYAISAMRMWYATYKREQLLLRRNWVFLMAGGVQTLVAAFFVSTSFVRHDKHSFEDVGAFLGVEYFSLIVMLLGGFNNIGFFSKRLPVFFKQRDCNFYQAAYYTINGSILRIPEYIINGTMWCIMVYFSVGFSLDVGRFFIFWLNLVLVCCFSTTLTQAVGSVVRTELYTQGVCGLLLMVLLNTSGFSIARTSIRGWWIWMYWINPLSYCLTSISVNEMLSPDWSRTATEFDSTDPLGLYSLKYRGFFHEKKWIWIGYIAQIGIIILLVIFQAVMLHALPFKSEFNVES